MKQIISYLIYYLIICEIIYIKQVLDKLPKKKKHVKSLPTRCGKEGSFRKSQELAGQKEHPF